MNTSSEPGPALWLRILHPLARLIVLGGVSLYFMAWAQARLDQFHDRPLLNIPIQIGLGLVAIALYYAYGKLSAAKWASLQRPALPASGPSAHCAGRASIQPALSP